MTGGSSSKRLSVDPRLRFSPSLDDDDSRFRVRTCEVESRCRLKATIATNDVCGDVVFVVDDDVVVLVVS